MKTGLIFVLALMLVAVTSVQADDDPETPWPIEERCVPAPSQPPADWTYSGTLLMSGYAGIHAMQANWERPRIAAFMSPDPLGYPVDRGQLSPDGRWYATPIGTIEIEQSLNRFWRTDALRVYSLIDATIKTFVLADYAEDLNYSLITCCTWSHDAVHWLDDESLIMGGLQFDVITEDVSLAPFDQFKYFYDPLAVSPDGAWIFDRYDGLGIYDATAPRTLLSPISRVDGISWQRGSSAFIAEQHSEDTDSDANDYLALYTSDGEYIERVFDKGVGRLAIDRPFSGRSESGWSHDDRYFAFNYQLTSSAPRQLMLLDTHESIVISMCLTPVSQPVWSPDSLQLSILLDDLDLLRVVVIDLGEWQGYEVARHSRDRTVIGTEVVLEPNIIGWRSDE